MTTLGQGGGTVLLEDIAAIEMTVLNEMVMDRGVDGSEFLQGLYVLELRHRSFSSSERLMRVFRPVVEPAVRRQIKWANRVGLVAEALALSD